MVNPGKSARNLIRNAGIVAAATFLSRILGFLRDMVTANLLGTSIYADAFFVAFRIPNLLRRLFGEGSLTAAFIPVFAGYLSADKRSEARLVAQTAMTLTALCLTVITILGIIGSPLIITLIAPGFGATPEKFALAVLLNRIMFPYILLISLVALAMGVLNADNHFLTPALAPVLLNVCMILAALGLSRPLESPALALAIGVIAGGLAQLGLQLWALKKQGFPWKPHFAFRHPAIGRVIRLMGPSMIGLAITQITIFCNTLLASFLPDGSISYLYFADRLIQFPLGIFAVALGTAVLPALSRAAATQDWPDFSETLSLALRLLIFIILPAMAGLIILSKPIVFLLFQHGRFSSAATAMTASTIIAYATGLWAYAGIRIIVPAFHSLQDTRTPVKIGGLALVCNLLSAVILMHFFAHLGLALATAIASTVNCLVLWLMLRRKIGQAISLEGCGRALSQTLLATAGMLATIILLNYWPLTASSYQGHWQETWRLVLKIAAAAMSYVGCARLLGNQELKMIATLIKKRRARKRAA